MKSDIGGVWKRKNKDGESYFKIRLNKVAINNCEINKDANYIYLNVIENRYKKNNGNPDYLVYFDDYTNKK